MKKRDVVKGIVGTIVGCGTAKIVAQVIVTLAPPPVKLVSKIIYIAGGAVLGAIAAEATSNYTEDFIDKMANVFPKKAEEKATTENA